MADRDGSVDVRETLLKIADALGISHETFLRDHGNVARRPPTKMEELELLNLFRMIDHPRERQACLDFIKTMAADSEKVRSGMDSG